MLKRDDVLRMFEGLSHVMGTMLVDLANESKTGVEEFFTTLEKIVKQDDKNNVSDAEEKNAPNSVSSVVNNSSVSDLAPSDAAEGVDEADSQTETQNDVSAEPHGAASLRDGAHACGSHKQYAYSMSMEMHASLSIPIREVESAINKSLSVDDDILDEEIPEEYLTQQYWQLRRTCDRNGIEYNCDLIPITVADFRTAVKCLRKLVRRHYYKVKLEKQREKQIELNISIKAVDAPRLVTAEMLRDAML